MKIQFNTDNNIQGNQAVEARVDEMILQHLGRFSSRLTRIEVHLSDTNAGKGGADDKHCALEARLENEDPIVASHDDEDVAKAVTGACHKLKSKLDTLIEKRRQH